MKSSDNQKLSSSVRRTVQKSTTLNRRYVKRPAPMTKKIMVSDDKQPDEPVITSANLEDAIQEVKNFEEPTNVVKPAKVKKIMLTEDEPVEKALPKISRFNEPTVEKKISIVSDEPEVKEAVQETVAKKETPKIHHEFKINVEGEAEEKVAKTSASKNVDLPPAPNPYQDAINARSDALEVKKAAGRSAKFYVGPSAEERKNAAIEEALVEVAKVEKPEVAKKKLSPRQEAAVAKRAAKAEKTVQRAKVLAEQKAAKQARREKLLSEQKLARQAKLAKATEKESVLQKNVKRSTTDMSLKHATGRRGGRGKRMILALTCSVACVVALAALVYKNIPDISVKVTAMQSGIEASYPSYVPRDFSLSSVYVDGDGAVVMEFKGPEGMSFKISEAESSWDSSALLNNYVKKNWTEEGYTAARENGITIYICNSSATWVNGGILYRISADSGTLTKKQIKNIVTSI